MTHDFFTPAEEALLQLAQQVRATGYHFVTITPLSHARVNRRPGNEWARDAAGVFGWSRPFGEGVLPPEWMELMRRAGALSPHGGGWISRVRFSTLGGQLFVHSAFPTAEADAVFFGPDTVRFAAAIEGALAGGLAEVRRVADIGCGAGPGAILAALARPRAEVLALDINDAALSCARVNAALAGAENVEARRSDLLAGVEGELDLILANPPYLIDPGERAYRHGGGPLGAGLSLAIVEAALRRLAPGGTLLLYTGAAMVGGRDPFRDAVEARLPADAAWSYREVDPDVFGEELEGGAYAEADRIAAVVLTLRKSQA